MVALEKTAVNLPEINEERSEARARARLGAPQQSQVCLQMDGWKCRAMSDRMWTENLVVATAPRYCGTVSRCFDLVWYASPFCLGPKLVAERLLRLVSAAQRWTAGGGALEVSCGKEAP